MYQIMEPQKIPQNKQIEKISIIFPIILPKSLNPDKINFYKDEYKPTYSNNYELKIKNDDYLIVLCYMKIKDEINTTAEIKFKIDNDKYLIKIKIKEKVTFAFNCELEKENIILSFLTNNKIPQDQIDLREKYLYFVDFLNKNELKLEEALINEGINSFNASKTFEYFIVLFIDSNIINKKYLYKLFTKFNKIKIDDEKINLNDLKDKIENIYQNKDDIIQYLQKTYEKYKDKEDKKNIKILGKNINIIFYFCLLYYYLFINDNAKSVDIINELNNKNRQILIQILIQFSSVLNIERLLSNILYLV